MQRTAAVHLDPRPTPDEAVHALGAESPHSRRADQHTCNAGLESLGAHAENIGFESQPPCERERPTYAIGHPSSDQPSSPAARAGPAAPHSSISRGCPHPTATVKETNNSTLHPITPGYPQLPRRPRRDGAAYFLMGITAP